MSLNVLKRPHGVLRAVRHHLPWPWDVDVLVDRLGNDRGRAIRLVPWTFDDPAVSGLWIPTGQADYIIYNAGAKLSQRDMIICHELAHILLGHSPNFDTTSPALVQALFPSIDAQIALRSLRRSSYAADDEVAAEQCATLLIEAALSKKRPPSLGDELGRLTDSLR